MNWSNIKNIMIAVLLVINLFLLCTMINAEFRARAVGGEVIGAAVEILESKGFSCETGLIPKRYKTAYKADAVFPTPTALAETLMGENVAFWSDGALLMAQKGGASLMIDGNEFVYKSGKKTAKTTFRAARKALSGTGFDLTLAKEDSEGGKAVFYMAYKRARVFGAYLSVALDADGNIAELSAVWPRVKRAESSAYAEHVTAFVPFFAGKLTAPAKITAVTLGYTIASLPERSNSYTLSPAWEVVTDKGETALFDASPQ